MHKPIADGSNTAGDGISWQRWGKALAAHGPRRRADLQPVEGRPRDDNFRRFGATAPLESSGLLRLNKFRTCSVDSRAFWAFSDEPGFANHPIAIMCGGATIRTTHWHCCDGPQPQSKIIPAGPSPAQSQRPRARRASRHSNLRAAARLLASAAARTPERVRTTGPTERSAPARTGRFNNPCYPNPSSLHDWSPES